MIAAAACSTDRRMMSSLTSEKAAHTISDDDALKVAAFIKSLEEQEAPPAEGE